MLSGYGVVNWKAHFTFDLWGFKYHFTYKKGLKLSTFFFYFIALRLLVLYRTRHFINIFR